MALLLYNLSLDFQSGPQLEPTFQKCRLSRRRPTFGVNIGVNVVKIKVKVKVKAETKAIVVRSRSRCSENW